MFNVEILVANPGINTDPDRNFSYDDIHTINAIQRSFKSFQVNPNTHPRLIDLYSGDGPIAKMTADMGWLPENITCVDLYTPATPVIKGVHWSYINLNNLAFALRLNEPLPPQVEQYRHTFDVVTDWLGFLYTKQRDIPIIHHFFARPGGYILNEGIVKE